MTHISYYPRKAWTPGNEALQVTTSASPYEAISRTTALGLGLYGATDVLGIHTYPAEDGVVFEGNLAEIDGRRARLMKVVPDIAAHAIDSGEYSGTIDPGYLSRLIENVGRPLEKDDNFRERMVRSIGPFAQTTTWDGCFEYKYNRPYIPPLDHRLDEILSDHRCSRLEGMDNMHSEVVKLPDDILGALRELSEVDDISLPEEILTALKYYKMVRFEDPQLSMKAEVRKGLKLADERRARIAKARS